jgi:5'-nucleotidase / UDP-sugar diphosphatase
MRRFSTAPVPFLSANLDMSGEPELQALVESGRITSSTVVTVNNERIGIVGATTPDLPFVSSPRNVVVNPDVAGAVQAEVDQLTAQGINKIILNSHLQSIENDLVLAPQLRNVDIMIAGGGGELLANPGALLIPGDEVNPDRPYPMTAMDADGNTIPVVGTPGDYRYVGQLIVDFDANGQITAIDAASGPVRVAGGDNPDAVQPDAAIQTQVVEPVQAFIDTLNTPIGSTQVALDGRRSEVRTRETNQGNLIADALLFEATRSAAQFGAPVPTVALQNGGGLRNDTVIPVGDITQLDTFNMLPFANFVTVVPSISAAQFKEILENAVSSVESVSGRFAQVAGFSFVWNSSGQPQELDADGAVVTPGTRVQQVVLDDGTVIVQDGAVVAEAAPLNIATIDFLARGGDQYPYRGAPFVSLGLSYQQALANYITDGLAGVITAEAYSEGGSGRITRTVRVATFNASLNRDTAGALITDLSTPDNAQAQTVAEIIQRVNPDIILINEFDYDADGTAVTLFADHHLGISQNGAAPVAYPYRFIAPSNTGMASGFDLNNDGAVEGPDDAFGFGFFPGQFGMAVYSKFPIDAASIRTFQNFLWQDMPDALLPDDPATPAPADWYTPEELAVFRLSSKSHWDLPIQIEGQVVHLLASHPTPPVFDGDEDRNGRRNHDEIRFWADYVNNAPYIVDDLGVSGGLAAGDSFVIVGKWQGLCGSENLHL